MRRLVDDLLDVSRITAASSRCAASRCGWRTSVRHAGAGRAAGARAAPARRSTSRPKRRPVGAAATSAARAGAEQPAGQCGQVHRPEAHASSCALQRAGRRRRDRGSPTTASASRRQCWRACSTCSTRRPQDATARAAGSGWASPSCAAWSRCTAAPWQARSAGAGQGSRFTVRLPPSPRRRGAGAAARRARSRPGPRAGRGRQPGRADTAAALLELSGYEVQVAYDPASR